MPTQRIGDATLPVDDFCMPPSGSSRMHIRWRVVQEQRLRRIWIETSFGFLVNFRIGFSHIHATGKNAGVKLRNPRAPGFGTAA